MKTLKYISEVSKATNCYQKVTNKFTGDTFEVCISPDTGTLLAFSHTKKIVCDTGFKPDEIEIKNLAVSPKGNNIAMLFSWKGKVHMLL